MNVIKTALSDRPLKNRLQLPKSQSAPDWRSPKTLGLGQPLAPSPPRFSGETKTAWEVVLGICRGGKGTQGRASGRERVTRWGEVALIKMSRHSNQSNHGPGSGKNVFIRAIRAIRGQPEPFPRGAGVPTCQLPHRPGACLFSPRAQLVAPKPPSDGGSPEAKACQFARRALFLCASVVKIREFHFGSSRLCVESGQPFLPRAPRLRPLAQFKVYSCHSRDSWATPSGSIRANPGYSG
jgi:hypothetical protein